MSYEVTITCDKCSAVETMDSRGFGSRQLSSAWDMSPERLADNENWGYADGDFLLDTLLCDVCLGERDEVAA